MKRSQEGIDGGEYRIEREVDRSDSPSGTAQLSSAHDTHLPRPLLSFMDASQFSRWTRFAKKGGIGRCVAQKNCAAEHPGDLMFFEVLSFLFLSSLFRSRRPERAMKSPF
jgi:hypothetical protein